MKKITSILIAVVLLTTGCATTERAIVTSSAGSEIVAKAANSVINSGLDAAATRIDVGNPYVHSVATGLRQNASNIVTAADVQRVISNYGDPNNKSKFKQLGKDVWSIIASAAGRVAISTAADLVANGLNQGALNK